MFTTSDLIELLGALVLAAGVAWATHPGFGLAIIGAYIFAIGFASHAERTE